MVAKRLMSQEGQAEDANISSFEILKMNAPEWYLILIGTLASIVTGSVQLVFAIVISEIIGVSILFAIEMIVTFHFVYIL